MKHVSLFGVIASILSINSVFAESQTITTQTYVDNAVATKQDKITGHPTGQYPSSVITDTASDGVVEKRLVLAPNNGFRGMNAVDVGLIYGHLVDNLTDQAQLKGLTADDLRNGVISAGLIDDAFAVHWTAIWDRQKNKVCVQYIDGAEETSENCLLWNLPD